MARHSRLQVLSTMKSVGLVPVFYHGDFDVAKSVARACFDGGAGILEFTNRGDRAVDVFRQLAVWRDRELQNMILGVGSIVDAPTAALYIAAGADFVVGPVLDEEVARLCNARKVPYCPGAARPPRCIAPTCWGSKSAKCFRAAVSGDRRLSNPSKGRCLGRKSCRPGACRPRRKVCRSGSARAWRAWGSAAIF